MTQPALLPEELRVAALLGTERQPFTLTSPGGPLGALLAALPDRVPEAQLLAASAVLGLYAQTGRLPDEDTGDLPAASPADMLPVCAETGVQRLAMSLGGPRRDVLPEALALLADAGKRVPEDLLPDLLLAGLQQRDLRPALPTVIGRRGRWLAAQNPEWAYAALTATAEMSEDGGLTDEQWQTAGRAARMTLFGELRARSPERARGLLESAWASEGADDRAAFLFLLADGLSLDDEAFLEAALDDRGKDVRRNAADALARLPGSRLVGRMTARADAALRLKRPLLGRPSLETTPPETCDAAMQRDGIEPKSPYTALGEKAWWLSQIVAAVPLAHWNKTWNLPPETLIRAAASGEWSEPVLIGWQGAAGCLPDDRWTAALVSHYLGRKAALPREMTPALERMSTPAFEALVLDALRDNDNPLHDGHAAFALLSPSQRAWSPVLARAVVGSLQRRSALPIDRNVAVWHTMRKMSAFALHAPPALAGELSRGWPTDGDTWKSWEHSVGEFLSILHFRHDLHKEISA